MTDLSISGDSSATNRLLDASTAGHAAAFAELLARHRAWLRAFVVTRLDPRLTARIDASDVVQETLTEAHARFADFLERRPSSFRTWLLKTAYDRLAKLQRMHITAARRSVRREVSLSEESSLHLASVLPGAPATPDERLTRDELVQHMRAAMAELPKSDCDVLLLRYVEGLNNQEIAYLLGQQPDAVSKRHGRALVKLHKKLRKQGMA